MSRDGLTLIEVMVALILTSITALLAHAIVVSVSDSSAALMEALNEEDSDARWREHLRQHLELLSDNARVGGFHGDSLSCSFGSLTARAGDAERWTLERRSDSLILADQSGEVVSALRGVLAHHVEYLEAPGLRRPWLVYWDSPASAPRAVRLRWRRVVTPMAEDTLILLTGAEG